jgi:hypothetical protein
MKLFRSEKGIPIPKLFFITDKSDILKLPLGTPFIFGAPDEEEYLLRILEYEVLYQSAVATGYPFRFQKILKENGFSDLESLSSSLGCNTEFNISSSNGGKENSGKSLGGSIGEVKGKNLIKKFIKDSSAYVDVSVLKSLNIFPVWMKDAEEAVTTNIHNSVTFDSNMYNKKLEGMYGGAHLRAPTKNLIIIDISGSIPRAVSSTCLSLAKNLSENFYADLLITGSKSTLYNYEEIHKLDLKKIYSENGMDNDQTYFKAIVQKDSRQYNTAIVFGDGHSPCQAWDNEFNEDSKQMSKQEGRDLCKWKVEKIVSFHTRSSSYTGFTPKLVGYAEWFSTENITHMPEWVKDLETV